MQQAVIDRFEGQYAVLLLGEQQTPLNVLRSRLPREAREGSWLQIELVEDEVISASIDQAALATARERIQSKLERLRRGEHLKRDT